MSYDSLASVLKYLSFVDMVVVTAQQNYTMLIKLKKENIYYYDY